MTGNRGGISLDPFFIFEKSILCYIKSRIVLSFLKSCRYNEENLKTIKKETVYEEGADYRNYRAGRKLLGGISAG
jgi:hypothetical protein